MTEAKCFREKLTKSLLEVMERDPRQDDSPVYTVLTDLKPPAVRTKVSADLLHPVSPGSEVHSALIAQANEAQKRGSFLPAKALLTSIRAAMTNFRSTEHDVANTEESCIIQRLALVTYKSKHSTEADALAEARAVLVCLNPRHRTTPRHLTSGGPSTNGSGTFHRCRVILMKQYAAMNVDFICGMITTMELASAYPLDVRAGTLQSRAEAITDFIQAERVRREVIRICERAHPTTPDEMYWVRATSAEAYIGIGENSQGEHLLKEAFEVAPAGWMKATTNDQIERLKTRCANSPLQYISLSASSA